MSLIPVSQSFQQQEPFRLQDLTVVNNPSFVQGTAAAFRLFNPIVQIPRIADTLNQSVLFRELDPEFDPFVHIPDQLKRPEFISSFINANSVAEVDRISSYIFQDLRDRDTLNQFGVAPNLFMGFLASVTDPIQVLFPGGIFINSLKGASRLARASSLGAAAALSTLASEPFLQLGSPTRTSEEAFIETVTSGILGAGLGSLFSPSGREFVKSTVRQAAQEQLLLPFHVDPRAPLQTPGTPISRIQLNSEKLFAIQAQQQRIKTVSEQLRQAIDEEFNDPEFVRSSQEFIDLNKRFKKFVASEGGVFENEGKIAGLEKKFKRISDRLNRTTDAGERIKLLKPELKTLEEELDSIIRDMNDFVEDSILSSGVIVGEDVQVSIRDSIPKLTEAEFQQLSFLFGKQISSKFPFIQVGEKIQRIKRSFIFPQSDLPSLIKPSASTDLIDPSASTNLIKREFITLGDGSLVDSRGRPLSSTSPGIIFGGDEITKKNSQILLRLKDPDSLSSVDEPFVLDFNPLIESRIGQKRIDSINGTIGEISELREKFDQTVESILDPLSKSSPEERSRNIQDALEIKRQIFQRESLIQNQLKNVKQEIRDEGLLDVVRVQNNGFEFYVNKEAFFRQIAEPEGIPDFNEARGVDEIEDFLFTRDEPIEDRIKPVRDQRVEDAKLDPESYVIVNEIRDKKDVTVSRISKKFSIPTETTKKFLAKLEEKGLIESSRKNKRLVYNFKKLQTFEPEIKPAAVEPASPPKISNPQSVERVVESENLEPGFVPILNVIRGEQDISLSEISRRLSFTSDEAEGFLGELEKRGLISASKKDDETVFNVNPDRIAVKSEEPTPAPSSEIEDGSTAANPPEPPSDVVG